MEYSRERKREKSVKEEEEAQRRGNSGIDAEAAEVPAFFAGAEGERGRYGDPPWREGGDH